MRKRLGSVEEVQSAHLADIHWLFQGFKAASAAKDGIDEGLAINDCPARFSEFGAILDDGCD